MMILRSYGICFLASWAKSWRIVLPLATMRSLRLAINLLPYFFCNLAYNICLISSHLYSKVYHIKALMSMPNSRHTWHHSSVIPASRPRDPASAGKAGIQGCPQAGGRYLDALPSLALGTCFNRSHPAPCLLPGELRISHYAQMPATSAESIHARVKAEKLSTLLMRLF